MSTPDLHCADASERRALARAEKLNGIDYVEVDDDHPILVATFLEKAPDELAIANVRIDGGRRVRDVVVLDVTACRQDDPTRDDCVRITLDRRGDASTYTLSLVEPGPRGRPGSAPLAGFDPRYASAPFSFAAPCRGELDCTPVDDCPPETFPEPVLSYLAKDYASFRALLLDRLALIEPDWHELHVPDLGITLVELLAYAGDQLSYFQDAVATEAYLETARRRVSLRRHLRLIDHRLHEGCNARAWVVLSSAAERTLEPGTFRFLAGTGDAAAVFEPLGREPVSLHPAHNTIEFWTWGETECCLAAGATAATLRDGDGDGSAKLHLRPGDVIMIEEVRGARTGTVADADPSHRQAVRLTSVTPGRDPVEQQDVLNVTWASDDALRFPLCLSSVGLDCRLQTEVSVARGNVVLVDHGARNDWCDGKPERVEIPVASLPEVDCDPCAPASPRRRLQALRDAGVALTEAQQALVVALVGEPEALRVGIFNADPAMQMNGLEQLLARHAAFPVPYSATLGEWPVTHSTPFPSPAVVAAAQARLLAAIASDARGWLDGLWERAATGTPPSDEEHAALEALFGSAALKDAGLDDPDVQPVAALAILRHRWARLLERPLRRLGSLAHRARAGYVLGAGVVAELADTWGAARAEGLDPGSPALAGPACRALEQDPSGALAALRLTGAVGPWTVQPDLMGSGASDSHVVVEVDDDGVPHVRFGDGDAGRAVQPGVTLEAHYRVGNGRAGNVGAEVISQIVLCGDAEPGIKVRNPLPACGGTEPESATDARLLAPVAIRHSLVRAVTAEDYATLAGQVPGVQRAAAVLAWNGSWYELDVAIDPVGTEELSPELRRRVAERLFPSRSIGTDLTVGPAAYVPLLLDLFVCVAPHHQRGEVRCAVLDALGTRTLPSGGRGMFHPDEVSFGGEIAVSAIVGRVQALPGVQSVQVRRLQRLGEGDRGELDSGVLRLSPLEVARLDNDPDRPENGRLVLELGGER